MPPETFSIRLLPATERSADGIRLGEIRVGSFVEQFEVYPFAGDVESVAARWSDALRSLLGGTESVGLPIASNMTWVLYRSGSKVFVQQMLMAAGVGPQLLPDGTVGHIHAHEDIDEDGQCISQWATTVDAISAFLAA